MEQGAQDHLETGGVLTQCAPRNGTGNPLSLRESWPGDLGGIRAIRVVQAPQPSVPSHRAQTRPFPRSQGSCVTPDPPGHCQAHLWVFHLSLLLAMEKASSRRGTNQITRQLMKIMGNKAPLEAAWLDSYFPVSLGSRGDVYNLTKTFHYFVISSIDRGFFALTDLSPWKRRNANSKSHSCPTARAPGALCAFQGPGTGSVFQSDMDGMKGVSLGSTGRWGAHTAGARGSSWESFAPFPCNAPATPATSSCQCLPGLEPVAIDSE